MNIDIESLSRLCSQTTGMRPASTELLPTAGGDRRYYRLKFGNGYSLIGAGADNLSDARAFINLSRLLLDRGIHVPSIAGATPDCRYYLAQDLGDISLFSVLGREDSEVLLRQTLRELAKMNTIPYDEYAGITAYRPFSRRQALWDMNYFKYEFLRPADITFDEELLEDDFERLADDLIDIPSPLWGFMMRDCQSRNVMLAPEPYFIDFQGGRHGPCVYDAVSLLWQAKAGFSDDLRHEMLAAYASDFASLRNVSPQIITDIAPKFAMFRTLQVLGAYGFRGLVQKRAHFIESIPGAIANLASLLRHGVLERYPELQRACSGLADSDRFRTAPSDSRLHIRVFSFSYKKGYPEDLSGNGGGFMFDCRGLHNPGRYDEYKHLTGRDAPVREFLRTHSDADQFARKACELVGPSVSTYLRRGFSSLQIGFGCTGGRHRSVYCAEAAARTIADRFPEAVVELVHREQNIREILDAQQNSTPI